MIPPTSSFLALRMDASFSKQGAWDLRGILLRIMQIVLPGLITELCDEGSTQEMDGRCAGSGTLAMEVLNDGVSSRERGKPEPGHRLVTGPWVLMLPLQRTGKTQPHSEQVAMMILVGNDIS